MLSHSSHAFSCLNDLKPCIEHFYIFRNIWNLILWKEAGKKRSSCSGGSKYVAFVLGQSEQQFKIQSHFGIFDAIVGEVKWYDDSESHALKCICELFGNISFFYWMISFLDIFKSLVDT